MPLRSQIHEHTLARIITAVVLLNLFAATSHADFIRVATTARDPGVSRVIALDIFGATNHPLPILYLSTKRFPTWRGESLIVLPPQRYIVLAEYTQGRIAGSDCPGQELMSVGYAVRITLRDKPLVQRCILQKPMACEYLAAILNIPGLEWRPNEHKQIADFMVEFACD
jgi:hypothetical protein